MTLKRRRRLGRLVDRLVSGSDWDRTKALLLRHPELVGEEAQRYLAAMAEAATLEGDVEGAAAYEYHRQLLILCQEIGVERAVARQREATRTVPDLVARGGTALLGYRATRKPDQLSAAVAAFEAAASLTLAGHQDRAVVLSNLGLALADRFSRDERPGDLDRSVEVLEEAVRLAAPQSPERSAALANLGIALLAGRRFDAPSGRIRRAVEVLPEAVQLVGDDSAERGRRLTNLGIALSEWYRRNGDPDDADRAVAAYEQATTVIDIDSPDYPSYLVNLGTGLAERYGRLGTTGDLDRAASLIRQAIAAALADTPDLADWTENLALILRDRYVRDGDLTDLEEAVALQTRAVELTPDTARERPGRLDQLATTLRLHAVRRGSLAELRNAVDVHREAARLGSVPAEECVVLNNFGGSLRALAAATPTATDRSGILDEAVRAYRDALDRAGSVEDRCAVLTNLGSGLLDRYDVLGRRHDLAEAVAVLGRSVADTDERSPELPARLNNLGNGLRRQYECDRRPADADAATAAYRKGWELAGDSINEAGLRCALNCGRWTSERGLWSQATLAYDAARSAADRLLAQHITRRDKQTWLTAVADLAPQAAYSCCRTDVTAAAVWLEWGRARVLSDALDRDRRDLAGLGDHPAGLLERYRTTAARIRALETNGETEVRHR